MFDKYFCNIASTLKQNSNSPEIFETNSYSEYLKNPVSNSVYLNDADAGKIYTAIKSFMNKATKDTKMSALRIANGSYLSTLWLGLSINHFTKKGKNVTSVSFNHC